MIRRIATPKKGDDAVIIEMVDSRQSVVKRAELLTTCNTAEKIAAKVRSDLPEIKGVYYHINRDGTVAVGLFPNGIPVGFVWPEDEPKPIEPKEVGDGLHP